ncbi:hypothetical protein ACQP3J_32930, partial [Escherichia coli]
MGQAPLRLHHLLLFQSEFLSPGLHLIPYKILIEDSKSTDSYQLATTEKPTIMGNQHTLGFS